MDDVLGAVPEARLVIAGGEGDDAPAVRSALENSSARVRERVHLLGRVDDTTVGRLYHRATVIAYPSLDEGFGFPVLEAMSTDTPIVASNVGSIPEVAGDAALLCPPSDRAAWIESLVRALTDDDVRNRMIDNGRRQRAKFDWSRTARELEHLYRNLVDAT
jgi:glycosyltransferase involved in cell wall biosynthesis